MAGDKSFTTNLPDVGEQRNPAIVKKALNELLAWVNEIFSGSGDPGNAGYAIGVDGDGNIVFINTDLATVQWITKSSNFTAAIANKYLIDTGVTAVALPNAPAKGDEFYVVSGSGFNMSGVSFTQAASGEYIDSINASYATKKSSVVLRFICVNTGSGSVGWRVFSYDTDGITTKSSNFTAAASRSYILDTGVSQVTLPNSPKKGDEVIIIPGNGFNMTGVSVIQAASGERIGGANATYVLPTDKSIYRFVCVNTGSSGDGWIPVSSAYGRQVTVDNSICALRLTTATGTPVTTTNQTAITTIYAALCNGNRVASYNATTAEWEIVETPQVSVVVPSTTVTPFDITLTHNISTGAVTLATVNWTNATTRATAVTYQDGVPMIGTARLLGTGRTTGVSGQLNDALYSRLLSNVYNKVWKPLKTAVSGQYTYNSTTVRPTNGDSSISSGGGGAIEFVKCLNDSIIKASMQANVNNTVSSGGYGETGLGLDSTTAFTTSVRSNFTGVVGAYFQTVEYNSFPGVGYHYLQMLEASSSSATITSWNPILDGEILC